MSKSVDWLPHGRKNTLNMAKNWEKIINESTSDTDAPSLQPRRLTANRWNIPNQAIQELSGKARAAETALTAAQNEETIYQSLEFLQAKTPKQIAFGDLHNAACKTTFDALITAMRDMKKRYFYIPPLTETDLVLLGLNPPDTTHTISGAPTAQVTIEPFLVGRRQLGLRFIYVTGTADDPANKGYRVYYKVITQGETSPVTPDELSKSFFTKRKKDTLDFEFGDSGKMTYFAVQLENEGKKGPWGTLVSALME